MPDDPLQTALGGKQPEPSGEGDGGNSTGAAAIDHPVLTRFGGDVQKALDAYQQLDREYGQQGDRLGKQVAALEAQLSELQMNLEPEPQNGGGPQNGLPDMPLDQLQEWFDENPAQATAFLIAQGQEMLLAQIDERLNERLTPIETNVGRTTASTVMDGLKKALGDDVVARNAQSLVDLQKSDPGFFKGDPQQVFQRMKTAVLAAEHEAGRGASTNGAAASKKDVAVEGGSSGRNPQNGTTEGSGDPEIDEFLAALDEPGVKLTPWGTPARS